MRKGKLILSSIRDFSKQKADIRCEIARYPKLEKYPQVIQLKGLAPSKRLLHFFKTYTKLTEDVLKTYYVQYKMEIYNSIEGKKDLQSIEYYLNQGKDVQLICFCADYRYCHRTIVGKWFESKGFEVDYN